jgi:hypothetical protein
LGTPSDQRIFHLLVFLLPQKTSKDIDSIFFIGKVESGHKHLQHYHLFHPTLGSLAPEQLLKVIHQKSRKIITPIIFHASSRTAKH